MNLSYEFIQAAGLLLEFAEYIEVAFRSYTKLIKHLYHILFSAVAKVWINFPGSYDKSFYNLV